MSDWKQIAISLAVDALAWAGLFRALRPFGLLSIRGRDIAEAVGFLLLGLGLMWGSYLLWFW